MKNINQTVLFADHVLEISLYKRLGEVFVLKHATKPLNPLADPVKPLKKTKPSRHMTSCVYWEISARFLFYNMARAILINLGAKMALASILFYF